MLVCQLLLFVNIETGTEQVISKRLCSVMLHFVLSVTKATVLIRNAQDYIIFKISYSRWEKQ